MGRMGNMGLMGFMGFIGGLDYFHRNALAHLLGGEDAGGESVHVEAATVETAHEIVLAQQDAALAVVGGHAVVHQYSREAGDAQQLDAVALELGPEVDGGIVEARGDGGAARLLLDGAVVGGSPVTLDAACRGEGHHLGYAAVGVLQRVAEILAVEAHLADGVGALAGGAFHLNFHCGMGLMGWLGCLGQLLAQLFVLGLQAGVLGLEVVVFLAPFAVGLVEVVDAAVQFVDAALVGGDALAEVAVLLLQLVHQLAPGFNLRLLGLGFGLFDCGGYGEDAHQTAAGGQSNQGVNPIYSHFVCKRLRLQNAGLAKILCIIPKNVDF